MYAKMMIKKAMDFDLFTHCLSPFYINYVIVKQRVKGSGEEKTPGGEGDG